MSTFCSSQIRAMGCLYQYIHKDHFKTLKKLVKLRLFFVTKQESANKHGIKSINTQMNLIERLASLVNITLARINIVYIFVATNAASGAGVKTKRKQSTTTSAKCSARTTWRLCLRPAANISRPGRDAPRARRPSPACWGWTNPGTTWLCCSRLKRSSR